MNISILLIVVILIALAVGGGYKIIQRIYISNKIRKWILGIYLGVFVLSLPILYLLPDKAVASPNAARDAFDKVFNLSSNFYSYAMEGKLDSTEGIFRNGSWSFKLEGERLNFAAPEESDIYIEIKPSKDGELEVFSYVTTHISNNIDFTKEIRPPQIALKSNTLEVLTGRQSFKYAEFDDDFPLVQFKQEKKNLKNSNSSVFGRQVIYVRVPYGTTIEKGKNNVIILGENNP